MELNTLIIRFDTPIRFSEIPLLRGVIASTLPRESVLFHNHMGEKLLTCPKCGAHGEVTTVDAIDLKDGGI